MPRISVGGSSGERSWKDDDKFVASFQGHRFEKINGDDAGILMFVTDKGNLLERWATKLWDRLVFGEPKTKDRPAQKPCLKEGMCVDVEVGEEKKLKGGKRFRQFKVEILTGKDIPKGLR
jgi:hypothetical protein